MGFQSIIFFFLNLHFCYKSFRLLQIKFSINRASIVQTTHNMTISGETMVSNGKITEMMIPS